MTKQRIRVPGGGSVYPGLGGEGDVWVLQGPGHLGGLLGAEGCSAETGVSPGVSALPRGGR